MSQHLDIGRLLSLIRVDLVNRYRTVAVVSATIAGLILIYSVLNRAGGPDSVTVYSILLFSMLFLWGPIAASHSLRELHDKTRNEAYLLLPASALEKALARLLMATVIFGVYVFVFVTVLSWIVAAVVAAFRPGEVSVFSPLAAAEPQILIFFIVNQSIYFLGAAWFKKTHFMKTALALTILSIGVVVFTGLMLRLFFPEFAAFPGGNIDIDFENFFRAYQGQFEGLFFVLKLLYYLIVPLFCWGVAWLRIKETQVSHGI